MFFVTIPSDELSLLTSKGGCPVIINGVPHNLHRSYEDNQQCLTWTNDNVKQIRPIVSAMSTVALVVGRDGLHPCVAFTCGDQLGENVEVVEVTT